MGLDCLQICWLQTSAFLDGVSVSSQTICFLVGTHSECPMHGSKRWLPIALLHEEWKSIISTRFSVRHWLCVWVFLAAIRFPLNPSLFWRWFILINCFGSELAWYVKPMPVWYFCCVCLIWMVGGKKTTLFSWLEVFFCSRHASLFSGVNCNY